jgi:hypothetical protein
MIPFHFGASLMLALLVTALGIFGWLTAKSSSKIKSFQFQISLFIVIWIVGELMDLLQEFKVIQISLGGLGIYVHA